MATKEPIRFQLTPEQREMVRKVTGKSADALELSAQELEERIAPSRLFQQQSGPDALA